MIPDFKALVEQLTEDEGYRQDVYECSNGFPTVGIGFALKDLKPKLTPELALEILYWQIDKGIIHISKEHSQEILKKECPDLHFKLSKKFKFYDNLPQMVKNCLINMSFQMGIFGVSKFKKALKAMENADWKEAGKEMLDSKWARSDSPARAERLVDIVREHG